MTECVVTDLERTQRCVTSVAEKETLENKPPVRNEKYERLRGSAGLLNRAGATLFGHQPIKRFLGACSEDVGAVLSASDASDRIAEKFGRHVVKEKFIRSFSAAELFDIFGKEGVFHICIKRHPLCDLFFKNLSDFQKSV